MPAAYEKLRDALIRQGKSTKDSKGMAARIFNSRRAKGTPPVTRYGR